MRRTSLASLIAILLAACSAPTASDAHAAASSASSPFAGLTPVDALIQPGERHFARLWQVTKGGENAEGYFSNAGDRLTLQRRFGEAKCDRIFVTDPAGGALAQVSGGRGVTTCSYFLPGDREIVFASTQAHQSDCPPPPDYSEGYVWSLHPEYDLWTHDLASGAERQLTDAWGYDAEVTVSPLGDRIVFTSVRSGDLELWTADLDGKNAFQVTDTLGYDGGAFFSHDGKRLVFRSTIFSPPGEVGDEAQYKELLAQSKIRPHRLELQIVDVDGQNRRQLTNLGGASFAPYFFVGDERVIFSSNHHESSARNFDLFAIDADGNALERITTYDGFDSFPQFSPDGRWLVFASNRGGTSAGETNLFVAEWK